MLISSSFFDNILHLDVHYACMLVQRFEPQGRCFTNFHYYYYYMHSLIRKLVEVVQHAALLVADGVVAGQGHVALRVARVVQSP